MTTPLYLNSANRLIQDACENAGLVASGQRPDSELTAKAFNKLNAVVAFQQTRGLKIFTNADIPLPLISPTNTYTLGPGASPGVAMVRPLRVIYAYFLSAAGSVTPITIISQQEWNNLQKAGQVGTPINLFPFKGATSLTVNLWPAPDTSAATGVVHLVLQQQITQAVSLTDTIAFPPEWYLGLMWALVVELSQGQPAEIIAFARSQRKEYLDDLEGWDVEDAQTFLTPDMRWGDSRSNFV